MAQDKTLQGVLLISASVFVLAFGDAISKQLVDTLTIWQIFFTRSLFALPIFLVLFRLSGTAFRFVAFKWVLFRSTLLVLTWIIYYASFPVLSLSVAAVAIYTFPIFVAVFSAVFTKEPATARQWIGIFCGFLGVVVILRPGTDAFSWFTLLPVLAASLLALAMILTRTKCKEESPLILSFSQLFGLFVFGLAGIIAFALFPLPENVQSASSFIFIGWRSMGVVEWALMAMLGVFSIGVFSGIGRAYQIAPPAIVAVFDNVYLISAVLWGFVFFAEKPDAATLSGMALIFCAGVLVAFPSAKLRSAK